MLIYLIASTPHTGLLVANLLKIYNRGTFHDRVKNYALAD